LTRKNCSTNSNPVYALTTAKLPIASTHILNAPLNQTSTVSTNVHSYSTAMKDSIITINKHATEKIMQSALQSETTKLQRLAIMPSPSTIKTKSVVSVNTKMNKAATKTAINAVIAMNNITKSITYDTTIITEQLATTTKQIQSIKSAPNHPPTLSKNTRCVTYPDTISISKLTTSSTNEREAAQDLSTASALKQTTTSTISLITTVPLDQTLSKGWTQTAPTDTSRTNPNMSSPTMVSPTMVSSTSTATLPTLPTQLAVIKTILAGSTAILNQKTKARTASIKSTTSVK
jgi:hypothetical protein